MSNEEKKYIDFLVYTMGMQSTAILYKHIAEYENKDEKDIREEYKSVDAWIAEKVFEEIEDKNTRLNKLKEIKEKVKEAEEEVKIIHDKFEAIKFGFRDKYKKSGKQSAEDKLRQWCKKSFLKNEADYNTEELLKKCQEKGWLFTFQQFYDWYIEQDKKCCYCETSVEDLKKIFKIKDSEDEQNKPLYSKKFSAELQIEKENPNKPYNKDNCSLACAFCNNAKSDMVNKDNFEIYFKDVIKKFMKDLLEGKSNEMSPF